MTYAIGDIVAKINDDEPGEIIDVERHHNIPRYAVQWERFVSYENAESLRAWTMQLERTSRTQRPMSHCGHNTIRNVEKIIMTFVYTNYKMETERRTVYPLSFRFGSSEYHRGAQWLMKAWCLDREAFREFAMRDMTEVNTRPMPSKPRRPDAKYDTKLRRERFD